MSFDLGIWRRVIEPAARERRRDPPPERPSLFAWAITEAESGSDAQTAAGLAHLASPTWAERAPGGYVLRGRKMFTSNGSVARFVCVHAALDRARPRETWTAFLCDTRAAGFVAARDERKLGQRASPATETVYDGVFVPWRDRVGPEGAGADLTDLILAGSRGPVGAIATGIARGALAAAVRAVSRLPPAHECSAAQPWVRETIGEMAARLSAARLAYLDACLAFDADVMPPSWIEPLLARAGTLVARAVPEARLKRACESLFRKLVAGMRDDGRLAAQLARASAAKALGADTAMWLCSSACDLVPPTSPERPLVDKALRDAKLTQIYEGTNQLNRLCVGEFVTASGLAP